VSLAESTTAVRQHVGIPLELSLLATEARRLRCALVLLLTTGTAPARDAELAGLVALLLRRALAPLVDARDVEERPALATAPDGVATSDEIVAHHTLVGIGLYRSGMSESMRY